MLITGNVGPWEGWDEDFVSELQLEHDQYYLEKLAESASHFVCVDDDDDTDDGHDVDAGDDDEDEFETD